jgi:hypothetical protein
MTAEVGQAEPLHGPLGGQSPAGGTQEFVRITPTLITGRRLRRH